MSLLHFSLDMIHRYSTQGCLAEDWTWLQSLAPVFRGQMANLLQLMQKMISRPLKLI